MKSVSYLIEYADAQLGKPYWYGTFGNYADYNLYKAKKAQYPKYYTADDYKSQFGQKVHDCAGLVKGAMWCDTVDGKPTYKASEDYGANKFYLTAEKKGNISSMPDVAGMLVFKGTDKQKTHVGVYMGNGQVNEAKGHKYGVVKSSVDGFKYWGQCKFFTYDQTSKPSAPAASAPADVGYSPAEIKAAYDCIKGKYGNGATRKAKLKQAGFDYFRVQGLVNKILRGQF